MDGRKEEMEVWRVHDFVYIRQFHKFTETF